MDDFKLESNESVIGRCDNAYDKKNLWIMKMGTLLVTSKNVIWAERNAFMTLKHLHKTPLRDLKIHDNQVQIGYSENPGEYPKITFYFCDHEETYFSQNGLALKELINKVNQEVTGNTMDVAGVSAGAPQGGMDYVVKSFKSAFGVFDNPVTHEQPIPVAKKCICCGASLSGFKGQIIKCPYCDTKQVL